MTRLTDTQLLGVALVATAAAGWIAGLILVYDLAPAVAHLVRWSWRRWAA
jgi:hypothetical protein